MIGRGTVFFVLLLAAANAATAAEWRVLPIRTEEQFNSRLIGGEGMQHMHSIARSPSNPDIIYLSHDGGQIWKSKDGGGTWGKPLGKGLYLSNGQSIAVDPVNPDIVFLIVDQWWGQYKEEFEGLYRSEDGGNNWKQVKKVDPGVLREYQHAVVYDPSSISATAKRAMTWYVGISGGADNRSVVDANGLFRSDDGGGTWSGSLGLTNESVARIYDIECHPTDGKTVYAATDKGLYRSSNRGEDIAPCGNLPEGKVSSVEINPKEPNMVYVVVYNDGLYRSLDGGDTFLEIKDYEAAKVFVNHGFPDIIYLTSRWKKTITSYDAGETWTTGSISLSMTGKIIRGWGSNIGGSIGIVPNPDDPNEAVCYSEAYLWKTTDGGQHFKRSSTLFTGYYWSSMAFDSFDPNRFATFQGDVAVVITDNRGDYFEIRNGKAPDSIRYMYDVNLLYGWHAFGGDFQPIPGSDIMVASVGDWISRYQLVQTDNAGTGSWQLKTDKTQVTSNPIINFNPAEPNIVYAGSRISKDAGETFNDIDFGEFGGGSIVDMSLSNPNTVYATSKYIQQLLRSDDKGKTWYQCWIADWVPPMPVWKMGTVKIDPKDPDIVYTVSYKYSYKGKSLDRDLIRGTWDGQKMSWERLGVLDRVIDSIEGTPLDSLDKPPLEVRRIAIDPRHPEIIYAGIIGISGVSHIWRSIDGGQNWEDITYNLPRQGVAGMEINPHTGELMLGTWSGTYILPPPYDSKNLVYDKAVLRSPKTYALSVAATGDGKTVPTLGSHDYDEETSISVRATPSTDWKFNGWSGSGVPAGHEMDNPLDLVMDRDKVIVANFVAENKNADFNLEDLRDFLDSWLKNQVISAMDFNSDGNIDLLDFGEFALKWHSGSSSVE